MPLQTVLYQECDTHGRRRWQGHFVCTACGRVYQSANDRQPRYVREMCKCGVRLMPDVAAEKMQAELETALEELATTVDGVAPKKVAWSGRPICYLCFRGVVKHYDGIAPNFRPESPVPDAPTE